MRKDLKISKIIFFGIVAGVGYYIAKNIIGSNVVNQLKPQINKDLP